MVFSTIFIIALTVTVLLVWFNSDAFIDFAKLVGGGRFFGIKEYERLLESRATLDYHTYLLEYKNSFFIRLITCPLCFGLWVSAVFSIWITEEPMLIPI